MLGSVRRVSLGSGQVVPFLGVRVPVLVSRASGYHMDSAAHVVGTVLTAVMIRKVPSSKVVLVQLTLGGMG